MHFDLQGLIYGGDKTTVKQIKKTVTQRIDKTITLQDKNRAINLIQSTNTDYIVITDNERVARKANKNDMTTVLFADRIPAPRSGYWFELFDCITLQKNNNTYDFDGVFHSVSDFTPPYRATIIDKNKNREWSSNYNQTNITYGSYHYTGVVSNNIPRWVLTGTDLELVVGDINNNVVISGRIGNNNRKVFHSQNGKVWSMGTDHFKSFKQYQKWVKTTDFDTIGILLDHNNGIPIV